MEKSLSTELRKRYVKAKKISRTQRIVEKLENRYHVSNMETIFFTPCIYFLKAKGHVVYIGETTSIMTRISQHIQENTKVFDSFAFEIFNGSAAERKFEESDLINKIKPFYNINHIDKVKYKF